MPIAGRWKNLCNTNFRKTGKPFMLNKFKTRLSNNVSVTTDLNSERTNSENRIFPEFRILIPEYPGFGEIACLTYGAMPMSNVACFYAEFDGFHAKTKNSIVKI